MRKLLKMAPAHYRASILKSRTSTWLISLTCSMLFFPNLLLATDRALKIEVGQIYNLELSPRQSRQQVEIARELADWHVLEIEALDANDRLDLGMRIRNGSTRTVDDDLGKKDHHERLILLAGHRPAIEVFSLGKIEKSVRVQIQLRPVQLQTTVISSATQFNVPSAGLYIPTMLVPQKHALSFHGQDQSTSLRQFRLLKIDHDHNRIISLRSSRQASFQLKDSERSPDHFIEIIAPHKASQLVVRELQKTDPNPDDADPLNRTAFISGLRDNLPLQDAAELQAHRKLKGHLTPQTSGVVHKFKNIRGPALIDLQGNTGDLKVTVRFQNDTYVIDYDVGGNAAHEMLVLPFKGDYQLIISFSENAAPAAVDYQLSASYPDIHKLSAGNTRVHQLGIYHLQIYSFELKSGNPIILDVRSKQAAIEQSDLLLTVYQKNEQGQLLRRRLDHDLGGNPGQERVKLTGQGSTLVVVRRPPLTRGRLSYQIKAARDPLASSGN